MGKYFVTIANRKHAYKVCRDDINKVFSCKIKKIPKLPAYHEPHKEDDQVTLDQDSELLF